MQHNLEAIHARHCQRTRLCFYHRRFCADGSRHHAGDQAAGFNVRSKEKVTSTVLAVCIESHYVYAAYVAWGRNLSALEHALGVPPCEDTPGKLCTACCSRLCQNSRNSQVS